MKKQTMITLALALTLAMPTTTRLRPEGDEQERNRRKRKGFQEPSASLEGKEGGLLRRLHHRP